MQGSPSSHGLSSAETWISHAPSSTSHTPTWHGPSSSEQSSGVPSHTPPAQLSDAVHATPSSQASPSASALFVHSPVSGSHSPTLQSSSYVEQSLGWPAHSPPAHASSVVQARPSSQGVPSSAWKHKQAGSSMAWATHSPVTSSQTPT